MRSRERTTAIGTRSSVDCPSRSVSVVWEGCISHANNDAIDVIRENRKEKVLMENGGMTPEQEEKAQTCSMPQTR